MAGPGRSRTLSAVVALWMLLALLPLRGWGAAVMHLPDAAALASAAAPPPCHGADVDDDRVAVAPSLHAAVDPGAACKLCDLCHGAAALPPPLQPGADLAAQRLAPAATAGPPAIVTSAPYRPPRG